MNSTIGKSLQQVSTNPFEEVATSASRPTQKKMARAPTTAREKDQYDKAKQLQLFKQWKREIRQGLAEGIYGPEIIQLLRLVRRRPDEDVLIRFVQQRWLQKATLEVRYNILSYIDHTMMRWNI